MDFKKINLKKILKVVARTENVFLIIALPAIFFLIHITPPAWGLDEQVHFARAYQISEGGMYPNSLPGKGRYGGDIPKSLVQVLEHGHIESNSMNRDLPFYLRKDIQNPTYNSSVEDQPLRPSDRMIYDFGPTGGYSPIMYMPAALGIALARSANVSAGSVVKVARLVQALFYTGIIYGALLLLRRSKTKWIVFLVALLPSTVFQAATINADAYTIGLSLGFFAVLIKLFSQTTHLTRKQFLLLSGVTIGLAFAKPSSALFILLIAFLPGRIFANNRQRILSFAFLLAGCLIVGLTALKGMHFSDSMLMYLDANTVAHMGLADQLIWIVTHPLGFVKVMYHTTISGSQEWTQSIFGLLGYNMIPTPYLLTLLSGVTILLAGLYISSTDKRAAILFTAAAFFSALSVMLLLYATFNEVGNAQIKGIQGRYFIPCIPFILYGISYLFPMKFLSRQRIKLLFIGVAIVTLYATTYVYWKALF